ncbi:phosphatidylinositol 3,4,5-trisphosphate-dependent Rac exchanger 1 protein [Spea bombifrons]|uniref:phosphatidylinositol 3,4,5-trisphosphate-dependent Rac exchanger 1 protein n=1 Tax=Spea bombifrons TaxID=233779 RepID=UPI002349CEFF|nr:phosphatidylinositol 3,4,5-trisphosphate-dependent Rac exchanger 1 protein [Spea bombifrons]
MEAEGLGTTVESSKDSDRQLRLRLCVLNEILNTERDYVGTLHFLQSAFLHRIRQNAIDKTEKISEEHVKILFSNIEDILEVHKEFLEVLEVTLQPEPQSHHELGNVFLKFKDRFCVYEEYCSNHEKALRLLMELNKIPDVRAFLLSCMLLGGRKTTDIPLEGYLLTPIQRICKYPLLLKELAKRTPAKHPDHHPALGALQAMKTVCTNINETKRQMEKLEALEQLQSHIEGWEGSNLTDICTQLLLQGTLLKISAGNIQERMFFLFDNLLVYCKRKSRVAGKKSTKRTKSINGSLYIFRGRINTEVMEVENVEDGTADYHSNGYTVTNGWKIHNTAKNKWFVCMAKTAEEKQKWMDAVLKEREQRESLKLGMERDAYVMIAEKGEKLYHMVSKKANLIKDRRRKFSTIPKCFHGNEFVSWLMENGEISKAEEGVNLGQALLENGIIHHVSDKHQFKNEQVLYRFRYDDGTYKARSELEDIMSKGVRLYCRLHSLLTPVVKDRDYHLKTYKSVIPGSKLVDWLISQGDCQTREEAVALGVGLCNNGFMHHVLEKSEFKDESQFFRFHADEEMEGTSSKNKQLRNDFRIIENILAKSLLILPQEEDYGFDLEEKNKAIVVKSVRKGSYAEMAGLQAGRKIYSINEDLVFLRPFSEVETMLNQSFCSRRPIRILVATKSKEIIKIPDSSQALCFQIRGAFPPYVHAVGRGSQAAAAGLHPGQCVLKVNGNNVIHDSYIEVLEHFATYRSNPQNPLGLFQWIYRTHEDAEEDRAQKVKSDECLNGDLCEDPRASFSVERRDGTHENQTGLIQKASSPLIEDAPLVSLSVENVHMEHGVVYEYASTAGIKCYVLEKIVEPRGSFGITAKILQAFVADDNQFVKNCMRLISMSKSVMTMPQFEFRSICDTKLENICERIKSYQEFADELKMKVSPSFKQATTEAHLLQSMDFCPTNCHINLMEVSYPKSTTSVGRSFSIRFGRKNSFFGLDPDQVGNLNPMSYSQHCIASMAAPAWKCLDTEEGDALNNSFSGCSFSQMNGGVSHKDRGLSHLLNHEDMEIQDAYLQLFNKLDVAVKEMKQYVTQINKLLSTITEPLAGQSTCEAMPPGGTPPSSLMTEEGDLDKAEHGGIKKVCFKVSEEDQEDSGHDTVSYRDSYSECNSNRDSVLSYTSVRSNSSYLGSDEMGSGDELPCDMRIPSDKQDKLHGCLEHLFNQVDAIIALLKGNVMSKAFEETKHFPMDHSLQEFQKKEEWTIKCRSMIQISIREDPWNLPNSIKTLVESIQKYVEDGKNQLLLALLKCTDTELQIRRDVIFCQTLVAAICTFTEQLMAALNYRYNNNGEYEESSRDASRKWLEQISVTGVLLNYQSLLSPNVKEERVMLEDIKVTLSDLDKVVFYFKEMDETLVANTSVFHHVEGSRQSLKVIFYLDSYHFSKLPTRFEHGGSLKLQSVLFTKALENLEGLSEPGTNVPLEELQQQINRMSMEKVQNYYRKLRAFYLEKSTDSNTTAIKIDQLIRPINALDELCRLMKSYTSPKPPQSGYASANIYGAGLLPISSELCYRLGACQIVMCGTGMQRSTLSVSLEQAAILARSHGLLPKCIMQATDIMRKQGPRVEISAKNLKVMDQMPQSAPRLYRLCQPPADGDL